MRLLKDTQGKKQLDIDIQQFNAEDLAAKIHAFEPEVIFALSDDENPVVLEYALKHWCHMGFFKPYKGQLSEENLDKSCREQLAKIIFLDKYNTDLNYFEQCGKVIYQDYLKECDNLLNFIFFCE